MKTPRLRRRKAGDLGALKRVLWGALVAAEDVMLDPEASRSDTLRACHAIATVGGAYAKVHEQVEVLARLEAVEQLLAQRGTGNP